MDINFFIVIFLNFLAVLCQDEIVGQKVTHLNLPEGSNCGFGIYNGTCVSPFRCLSVLVSAKKKQDFAPLCTFKGNTPIICCTDCELVDDIRPATYIATSGIYYNRGRISDKKCLQYLDELPYSCKTNSEPSLYYDFNLPLTLPGDKACRRLFGLASWYGQAKDDMVTRMPHLALLGYGNSSDTAQYLCAGSVISEKYILTAGNCISRMQLGPVKYVGLGIIEHNDSKAWKVYNVTSIISHPEFKPPLKYHDIALLEVEKKIEFDESILPACLNTVKHEFFEKFSIDPLIKNFRDALLNQKSPTYSVGWNMDGMNRTTLQKIPLGKYSDEECSKLYPMHHHMSRGYDKTTQICYGDHAGMEICNEDSGSPLLETVRANVFECQFRVIGVTSNPCGSNGDAGLYTRVEHYLPWIESIVWPDAK